MSNFFNGGILGTKDKAENKTVLKLWSLYYEGRCIDNKRNLNVMCTMKEIKLSKKEDGDDAGYCGQRD